ncbi:T6SS immunity protein Tli4 family protein [Massilia sp. 9096]|uniref:T6SS immunity protein Tli4 family protein n=1 Tax=Massilia sp. 9096 TaxID=1500894 RepID=UPI0012E01680|nr:T6SS immunity protein Tli4 family protein [Massilia sp. 9096]
MTSISPNVQNMLEKNKTVCFGRFLIDLPESATVVWGDVAIPLGIEIYQNDAAHVELLAQKFIDELNNSKAIYHNNVSLLISVDEVKQPKGKIITGYENSVSINSLKINGYFTSSDDGIIINARPLKDKKDVSISLINSMAQRLRQRAKENIPINPGNCINKAFLADDLNQNNNDFEHIRIGFRLKEFPDAHLSIYVAPSNSDDLESDSLEAQWKRMKEYPATSEFKKALANTKFFRESPRQIYDWKTGYEVLMRSPDEDGSFSHHDFQLKFVGVPHDPYKPYADIQFQTGVADNAAGATQASLTDDEAIAVWDKITSTIRVRPTSATPTKTAGTDTAPRLPLGELAATGRTCPQTGWWEPSESESMKGERRQHIKAGERMPHVVSLGEPSIWQKLRRERPTYRSGTVWKLVSYDDAATHNDMPIPNPAIAQAPSSSDMSKDASNGTIDASGNEKTPPQHKG